MDKPPELPQDTWNAIPDTYKTDDYQILRNGVIRSKISNRIVSGKYAITKINSDTARQIADKRYELRELAIAAGYTASDAGYGTEYDFYTALGNRIAIAALDKKTSPGALAKLIPVIIQASGHDKPRDTVTGTGNAASLPTVNDNRTYNILLVNMAEELELPLPFDVIDVETDSWL